MAGPILLCNSIGINFGYPEPDFFRTETFFSLKGYRVIADDIRIRVYAGLKSLFMGRGIQTVTTDVASQKLKQRISQEEINGTIEDYLDLAACTMLDELPTDYHSMNVPVDRKALEFTVALIREEIGLLVEKAARFKPLMACFFIMPRKVRETLKAYNLCIDSEFLYPFLLFREISAIIGCQLVVAVNSNESSLVEKYTAYQERLPETTFVNHNIHQNIEHLFKMLVRGDKTRPSLPGTILYDGQAFHINRPAYESTNEHIVPDYSTADKKYLALSSHPPMLLLDGSVGCPMKCAFCNVAYQFGPYHQRPAEDIARELIVYRDTLPMSFVIINDRIFNTDMKRLHRFCDYLIGHDYKGAWCAYMALRKEMTLELLQKVHRAGGHSISYGLESASPRILKLMKKDYSPRLASRILNDTYDAGISIQLSLMTDFPGETERDFQLSMRFIEQHFHLVDGYRLNQFEVYKGSDVDLNPEAYGLENQTLYKEFRGSRRLKRLREFILRLENESTLQKSEGPPGGKPL